MVKDILFPSKRINLILYLLPHCSRHQFYRAEFVSRHCKILWDQYRVRLKSPPKTKRKHAEIKT